ncbi:ent-kaurenoic acid oxidase 2-like [Dorcoceras hygrometricum]|uniref:Ent-kaurenoic acid oxidase 2-like n=1 Tax=Dorcoceras hygrometricum TaxID=472368 RepID=A0A2Z7APJ7_9LAMI|nr:ent-kaurenoic acid oxidase 2-like [Dorcoceras hygrometricum]
MGIPFLGDMLAFLWYFKVVRRPDVYITSKLRKYGDRGLYRTHLFGSPSIIVSTPSANKFVLQADSDFIMEWPTHEIVGATSLVSVEGASHDRVRSFVVRCINRPDALRRIALVVQPRITASLKQWAHKGRIVVHKEAKKVTFENIGKFFAGFESEPVLDTLDDLFKGLISGIRSQPINLPGTTFHHALQCRNKAIAIFREEMEKRRKDASNAKDDLMEGLMKMKDEEGKHLSDIEILDNIVSLVVAGYASTSLSIMWAVYYLAKYPNVLEKLQHAESQEEHIPIHKRLDGEYITYDDISKCKYTNKVVEEVLRMANIAAFIFRTAREDVEYKGYKIPKGWRVICWIRYIHENQENFEDPRFFNPDRWNETATPGTFLVFGGGPRICPGNMLARLQVSIIIHYLVVGYRWKLVNPDAGMTYLPHPKPADDVVTFGNIGKFFAGFEFDHVSDTHLFKGLMNGIRSQPTNFPGTAYHHALKCRNKVVAVFREEMENSRKTATVARDDLMEGLVQMQDEQGKHLSDIEILDNIVSLVVAGYASTSVAIMWALYYLAEYPNVLEKLRVVEEVLRLANLSAFIFRTARKDVAYKGYKIPKGWKVMCWSRYIHENPENFENHMEFNPERWNEPAESGTFLVFGGGSRICPGNVLSRSNFNHNPSTGCRIQVRIIVMAFN